MADLVDMKGLTSRDSMRSPSEPSPYPYGLQITECAIKENKDEKPAASESLYGKK